MRLMEGREITLDYFKSSSRFYHIYKLNSSIVAESPHHHDYFQICFVTCGDIAHQQGEKEVTLVKGDAFIIPPVFTHSIVSRNERTEFFSLSFQEQVFYPGFFSSDAYKFLMALRINSFSGKKLDIRLKIRLNGVEEVLLESLLDCLLRECTLDPARDATIASHLIASILVLLSRNYFAEPDGEKQLRGINEYHDSIRACIKHIDMNYMKPLTLIDLARKFMLSRSTFCFLFPQIAGVPLKRYINKKRIEQAVSLLLVESLPLHEIATLVGYDDISTFYRNFTRIMGVSPTQYRKAIGKST